MRAITLSLRIGRLRPARQRSACSSLAALIGLISTEPAILAEGQTALCLLSLVASVERGGDPGGRILQSLGKAKEAPF